MNGKENNFYFGHFVYHLVLNHVHHLHGWMVVLVTWGQSNAFSWQWEKKEQFCHREPWETRLTYNCAHLRSTKESLTYSVKNLFVRKNFCVKIFLGENLLGEHFLSEHFFLSEIFWMNIFLSENCGWYGVLWNTVGDIHSALWVIWSAHNSVASGWRARPPEMSSGLMRISNILPPWWCTQRFLKGGLNNSALRFQWMDSVVHSLFNVLEV